MATVGVKGLKLYKYCIIMCRSHAIPVTFAVLLHPQGHYTSRLVSNYK